MDAFAKVLMAMLLSDQKSVLILLSADSHSSSGGTPLRDRVLNRWAARMMKLSASWRADKSAATSERTAM